MAKKSQNKFEDFEKKNVHPHQVVFGDVVDPEDLGALGQLDDLRVDQPHPGGELTESLVRPVDKEKKVAWDFQQDTAF